MMEAWWVRVVSMVTNTNEDIVACMANEEAYYMQASTALVGGASWREWHKGATT
jgi:hypothetical protein